MRRYNLSLASMSFCRPRPDARQRPLHHTSNSETNRARSVVRGVGRALGGRAADELAPHGVGRHRRGAGSLRRQIWASGTASPFAVR